MVFEVIKDKFYLDGKEIKIISGAVHYFRNMPSRWDDIFKKMKALGCNCVETYVAWNMHEKEEGKFSFDGILDIVKFIKMAQKHGLLVIVRPGPYICAEWEFGGLPWWLLRYEDLEIRCSNERYTFFYKRYLNRLFTEIKPLLSTNGGPIIMMQCENEYGYYGDDKVYLQTLRDFYVEQGINVPLFTSDGVCKDNLLDGSIDGCFSTLNFGSNVAGAFSAHDELYPSQPKMCMELWDGWFDAWGDKQHHTRDALDYAKTVDDMLNRGSVNMFLFIGGTSFGFMSGANHTNKFMPQVSSYDFDALLSEAGDITEKYLEVRKVIQKHTNKELPKIPPNSKKKGYGIVRLNEYASIFDALPLLSTPVKTEVPMPMEHYNQGYGYIAYQTSFNRDYTNSTLSFESLGDRAQIYINKQFIGTLYINDESLSIKFSAKKGDVLTILCENMGHANFGEKMMRKKGIVGKCIIDEKVHFHWTAYPLPMDNLDKIKYSSKQPSENSCFYKGMFMVDEVADTFVKLDNFKKGFVTINGFNIGRYWEIGPQDRLYIPMSLLKQGENEIIVFETDGTKGEAVVEFVASSKN